MKLLLTLDFPPEKGGIQNYLFERVAHCYGPGDCVLAAGCGSDASWYLRLPCPVVSVTRKPWPVLKKLALAPLLLSFIKQWVAHRKGMIVECGNVYAALVPWLFSFFWKIPYHVYTHGTELIACQKQGIASAILRSALKRAAGLYANSAYSRDLLRALGVATPVVIEPPRLERSRFINLGPAPRPNGAPLVLSVGRLVAHKGHAILLRAIALVPPGSVRCTIVGDGPLRNDLAQLVKELPLDDTVELCGAIDDATLKNYYARSSLFILPSLETGSGTEGFGIVLLEAMAHRIPIIASKIGGIPEVLDHGSCGVLVPPNDPQALAKAISELMNDKAMQEQFTDAAYERLQKYYIWK